MVKIAISMDDAWYSTLNHFTSSMRGCKEHIEFDTILINSEERNPFLKERLEGETVCKNAHSLKILKDLAPEDLFIVIVDGDLYDAHDHEYFYVGSRDYPTISAKYPRVSIFSTYYLNPQSRFTKETKKGEKKKMMSSIQDYKERILVLTLVDIITSELTGLEPHEKTVGCVMDKCIKRSDILNALIPNLHFCDECKEVVLKSSTGNEIMKIIEATSSLLKDIVEENREANKMVQLVAPAIVGRGLEFLFESGREILKARQERRNAEMTKSAVPPSAPAAVPPLVPPSVSPSAPSSVPPSVMPSKNKEIVNAVNSKDDPRLQYVRSSLTKMQERKIEHDVQLMDQYVQDFQITQLQLAHFGPGTEPLQLVNQKNELEERVETTMRDLQETLSAVYNVTINIPELV